MSNSDDSNATPRAQSDESGPYRLADEANGNPPKLAPGLAGSRRDERLRSELADSGDADPSDVEAESEDEGGSLPPPISRPAPAQPWLVIAAVCAALLFLSWLAGAPQLSLPDADGNIAELGFGERLNGIARTAIHLPLAMLAAVIGLCALAFVRQRPIGAPAPLFAKSLAIVCLASLLWLVPSDVRMLKQGLNVVGVPLVAGVIAIPVFRLHPRDTAAATAYAILGMLLLVGGAWVIVWATT